MDPEVTTMVDTWVRMDPDTESTEIIKQLQRDQREAELRSLLCQRLEFGTAGLRGKMGPGFSRMNLVTVQQTSQGLCKCLEELEAAKLGSNGILIGHDARHHSREFAEVAARVFLSRGHPVQLFSGIVPTPFVAFGVSLLGCAAGVMVTASHNTKEYNGYKVYWSNGCQIIPPNDAAIAAAIDANLELWQLPPLPPAPASASASPPLLDPTAAVTAAYFSQLGRELHHCSGAENAAAAPIVYTPLHGVGAPAVRRAFEVFNLPAPLMVKEQEQPDPEFPTVVFPNPEEGAGTWQLAFDAATRLGARVVLANDPDADRLAAAEQDLQVPGSFRTFSGNDIGLLLAHWVWTNYIAAHPDAPWGKVAMLASAVSSKALRSMAEVEGFRFEETLTGFKWLGNTAQKLEREGYEVLFAFEEAIGFMFARLSQDKDGVAAAAVFAEMAASLARRGSSVGAHLDWLYTTYGRRVYRAGYYVADPPSKAAGVFDALRAVYPQELSRVAVTSVRDLGTGLDTSQPDQVARLPWSPGDLMVTFNLEGGGSLTLRASATEPKLKYYLEVVGDCQEDAEKLADALEAAVDQELVKPELHGLGRRPAA